MTPKTPKDQPLLLQSQEQQPQSQHLHLLQLDAPSATAEGELPTKFKILNKGITSTTKGPIIYDDMARETVIPLAEHHGVDLMIDYDHALSGPAAGWFRAADVDGELWAVDVSWTPKAAEHLRAREYRYISPALYTDADGRITSLLNVALVNMPVTDKQQALVASQLSGPLSMKKTKADTADAPTVLADAAPDALDDVTVDAPTMAEAVTAIRVALENGSVEDALAALGELEQMLSEATDETVEESTDESTEASAVTASVAVDGDLTTLSAPALLAKVVELQGELDTIRATQEADAKTALITELSQAGKLPPALHSWASGLDIATLRAYGASAPTVTSNTPAPTDDVVTLTDEQRNLARKQGVSEAAYLKALSDRAKNSSK